MGLDRIQIAADILIADTEDILQRVQDAAPVSCHESSAGILIAGNGVSTIAVTCATQRGEVAFSSHYADGTNTLRFDRYAVRFAEKGRRLLAGDQTLDLSEGQKIVHLKRGKVVVE